MPLTALNEKHPLALAREARARAMEATYEDGQDYCRICRGEDSPNQPLYYPCKCSGSIKFVHQECLMEWLSHSQKKYCELCKTSFRFTKLYDRSMPATLPFPLFLRQLARHGLRETSRWLRYFLVGVIWTCCLPWCIRQVWRGLFWLADGNWVEEKVIQVAAEPAANTTAAISAAQPSQTAAANFTVPQYLERIKLVLPPMQISLADLARVVFSQGLIGRLLQLIWSVFVPRWRQNDGSSHAHNATSESIPTRRKPSLLSDVQYLTAWSNSSIVNNALVDVAEGQLICVLLVAAFILVFLIREWVINQQPILNMPDPDAADNPLPPRERQPENERLLAVRPRPRNRRHGGDEGAEVEPAVLQPGERPIAVPRLRRALTDDNILNATGNEVDRPILPTRSQSLLSNHQSPQEQAIEDAVGESSAVADDTEPHPVRRHSFNNSVGVQRELEGAPKPNLADSVDHERIPVYFEDAIGAEDVPEVFDSRQFDRLDLQEREQSISQPTDHFDRRVSFAEIPEAIDEGDLPGLLDYTLDRDGSDSDERVIPTPDSSDADHTSQPVESSLGSAHGEAGEVLRPAGQPPVGEATILGKISKWLWHTDAEVNPPVQRELEGFARVEDQDDEHVVENVFAEAPFVPNHNREAPEAQLPALEAPPAPPAEVREPNVVFGVDLNDPNAADDAEDLDGVLELLGMEGPIFGMVQNVIFSLFLITLTLSASVWCPYIWGKIALLFLSNPTGMLIKAPLLILSKGADIVVDIIFFVAGLSGFLLNIPVKIMMTITSPFLPALGNMLDTATVEGYTLDLSQKSGARLEKMLSGAFLSLRPDLPTFSMLSHYALVSFKASVHDTVQWSSSTILQVHTLLASDRPSPRAMLLSLGKLLRSTLQLPEQMSHLLRMAYDVVRSMATDLTSVPPKPPNAMNHALVEWSTEDRILTIILGYAFFAFAGVVFLEIAHLFLGLKDDEKVEGYFADCLRQAGGVMKVIVIIGIEMLVFPLYCGLLLDAALLPLFANATFASRITFMMRTPLTGIFIHWFIGTCYMFHFALFVSICRKIMRKGVLYFIRDPDDPSFHPVRDVLERPVPAQLGKIAFSALVYGGLVIVCLGGVVWSITWVPGVFPIQWATPEPRLAFPLDIIFYNFMLPLVLRRAEPSKKISAMYEWWFRGCARVLRLTHFMFGEEQKEETYHHPRGFPWSLFTPKDTSASQQDGIYVRAPASDSVRIAKGRNVFLEVTEQNERKDGQPDADYGMHGKKDPQFTKVYLPPQFRARIATFIFFLWVFAASTGVAFTIGPLLVGRQVTQLLSQSKLPPNDLYSLTVGIHLFAAVGYTIAYARPAKEYLQTKIPQIMVRQVIAAAKHVLGLFYLSTFISIVLPFTLSLITELYIFIPLYTYLDLSQNKQLSLISPTQPDSAAVNEAAQPSPTATIFILQSWTIGLLYTRLLFRMFTHYIAPDSQVAVALRAIVRHGYFNPDVRLASRAFVLPVTVLCIALLALPLGYAKFLINILGMHDAESQMRLYRLAYPSFLGLVLTYTGAVMMRRQLDTWRVKIRDEVYLIGERLHNFHEAKPEYDRLGSRKGKEKAL